ncbi:DNA polymerase [Bacillus licheniformis]|nr:DNA polymerase [Bacillus licheniformis]
MDVHTKRRWTFSCIRRRSHPCDEKAGESSQFRNRLRNQRLRLVANLGITRKEAAAFIERYFHSFQGVKEYMEETVQEAKQRGYVTTL